MKPFVSVVIPVLNDKQRLQLCLQSLVNQSYCPNHYEVIVVDNGSRDTYEDLEKQFPFVSFYFELMPGSYAARNKGIRIAKGEIIAFTDSDCIPESDWIEKGVKTFLKLYNCGVLAGKIEIFFEDPENPSLVELYEKVSAFPQKKYVCQRKFGATANVFTSRQVIEKVGFFNDALQSGGDREWGERVADFGFQIIYADEVLVRHPGRKTLKDLHRKIKRQTSGMLTIQTIQSSNFVNFYQSHVIWLAYILPSPRILRNIFVDASANNVHTKVKLMLFMVFVKQIRLIELLRITLIRFKNRCFLCT